MGDEALAPTVVDTKGRRGAEERGHGAAGRQRPSDLPDGSGVEATRQILSDDPHIRILVLTMDSADATTVAAP